MSKCTATSKRTGNRCKANAVTGRNVCYHHGGATPRGMLLPQTTHGRFSKDLPTRLLANYEAAATDPDLVALREEMAILVSREADLIGRVDSGEAGRHWRSARAAWGRMMRARSAGKAEDELTAEMEVEAALADGVADYAAWDELLKTIEARRRLADTERRRLEALEQSINRQQALLLTAALQDAVRRHVTDRDTIAAIGLELGRILAHHGTARGTGDDTG